MKLDLALPLFQVVDRDKVDPDTSDLAELARQLGGHFEATFGIRHDATSIEGGAQSGKAPELYVVLHGVPEDAWPAFLALCHSRQAVPLHFRLLDDTGRFTLRPLGERA